MTTLPVSADKQLYRGQKQNQVRHGVGVYTYMNGLYTYKGEWRNGLKHGNGEFYIRGGGFYKGVFFEGEIDGNGERFYENSGATYVGHFCKGERHGLGRYVTHEGVYEGNWIYNKIDGFGAYSNNDGSSYEGEWHNNNRHGEGTESYINGSTYEGCWVQNLRHGHGVHHYADKSIYEGQWKNDLCHGEGILSHKSGINYFGQWAKGIPILKATRLRIEIKPNSRLEIGVPFNLEISVLDGNGSILECESGRQILLQVIKRKDVEKKDATSTKGKSIDEEAIRSGRFSLSLMTGEYILQATRSTPSSPCSSATSISLPNTSAYRQIEAEKSMKGKVTFQNLFLPDFKNVDVTQMWKKLKKAKTVIDSVNVFKSLSSRRAETHNKLIKPSSETDLSQINKQKISTFNKNSLMESKNLREPLKKATPKQDLDLIIVACDVTSAPFCEEVPLVYQHIYAGQPSLLRLTRTNDTTTNI